jgi:Protein of unknown function (DUF1153)
MARPVIGPVGTVLALENLPPENTLRWSKRRKCELLAAIDAGLLSRSEACSMYRLSVDEVVAWRHALARFGIEGLRARRPRVIPLRHRLFTEINRLAELAQTAGAAATASLLKKAAAETAHDIFANSNDMYAEEQAGP